MTNGFIYEIVNVLVLSLNYLNLVELFKFIAKKLTPIGSDITKAISNCNIAIDIFIVLKWIFIIYIWSYQINNSLTTLLVFYLIWSNVHTYFYYHFWKKDGKNMYERVRRRFISLFQAVSFMVTTFGYLYSLPFYGEFLWPTDIANKSMQGLIYSLSQTLFVDITPVKPSTLNGQVLATIQTTLSFIFIAILLAKSIPQDKPSISRKAKNGISK